MQVVGEHRVTEHPADLARHTYDWSPSALIDRRAGKERPGPACVVRPHSTAQVGDILEWAQMTGTPVVPFGGGSNVVEAIDPRGAVAIEMRAMNEVVDFDATSRLVTVQAGMIGQDLDDTLASWGFRLGHEPQSLRISTVGGWVATRACGQLSARFGGIEDLVAGLTAVLPGGRTVVARPLPRRAAGPDIPSLMIGSEGALGVVTEVTLRVTPLALQRADLCLRYEHMADGVAACRALAQSDLNPTVVRLYDRDDVTILLRDEPGASTDPLLLLSFEDDHSDARAEAAERLVGGSRGDDSLVGHWWEHRNDAVDTYVSMMRGEGLLGPHAAVDTIEVAATWSRLRLLYHSMKDALGRHADIAGCHLSHVYPDGACLYFTLAKACSSDEDAHAAIERWWDVAMGACLEAGGTISHHHGIGRRKAPWIERELEGWFEVLRAVKRAVDPKGIMNPGVLGL